MGNNFQINYKQPASHHWHNDKFPVTHLKLFVLLSDNVTAETGATNFMSLLWDGKTPSPLGEHFSKIGCMGLVWSAGHVQEGIAYNL